MGQESASYFVTLAAGCESEAVFALQRAGAELVVSRSAGTRIDLCLHAKYRYWIDLRIHRPSPPCLGIRIALTNDQGVIRAPLETALSALAQFIAGQALRDEDGAELAAMDQQGWCLELEQHYGDLRDAFIRRVGDFTAPISADHVYMHIHQTHWNRHNDDELAWHREREIAKIEEMWEKGRDAAEKGRERS